MKKLLLTLAAACAVTTASAAVADLTKVWAKPVENAYQATDKAWNAPVAVDAAGNVIAAGAFTEDFTLAGASLEAVGTSAYVVKYDKTGAATWAVAFKGAATVTAIDTDADGNIYVAGTFADEVTFGSTDNKPIVKEGLKIEDAFTPNQSASFIAKYNAEGVVNKVVTFVPEPFTDLVATGMYYPEGTDVFFRINHIKIVGSKLYASAIYTNVTTYDGIKFEGNYNELWDGMFYDQIKACSVFTLNSSLNDCMSVARCGSAVNLATDDGAYEAKSVNFTVDGGKVYAVFTGNGPLQVKCGLLSQKTVEAEPSDYNYILAVIDNGTVPQLATVACPSAGFSASYVPAYVAVTDANIFVAGNESFTKEDESYSNELFVLTAPTNKLADAQKKVFESVNGDVTYYNVTSAAILPEGEIYINALGYYNNTKKEGDETIFKNGDFADAAKSYVFANDAFAPATTVADAVGVASSGSYVAFSQIGETGPVFSLYNDSKASGIADIVADENAEAEYFNLQGVRVANPENGLYIVRRGNTVTKEIVK